MPKLVEAEGAILQRIVAATPLVAYRGLSRDAFARYDAAQAKTAWALRHRRRFALMQADDVLARHPRLEALLLHQPNHALSAHLLLLFDQVAMNARTAVTLFAGLERRPHENFQPVIALSAGASQPSTSRAPRFKQDARSRYRH